jgi:outer membrane protein TolC
MEARMRRSISLYAAVAIMLVLSAPAVRGDETLTLLDAVRVAMDDNHELRALRSSLSAQQETIGIARSALLPRIYFSEQATRTNNPPGVFAMKLDQQRFSASDFAIQSLNNPAATNDFQTLFGFEQPVFSSGAYIGVGMAQKEYSAQQEEYRRKREEMAFRVVQGYLRVHTVKAYLLVAQQGLDDGKEHLRIAEARYRANLGLYSDTLRAKTALTEAEQRLVKTRKDYEVAKRWLGLLLGRSSSVDAATDDLPIPLRDVGYYVDASLSRKDLRALQMRYENAKEGVKLAESQYLPTLGVGGAYQMNDPSNLFGSEGQSWRVAAVLRWNLFDGTSREYERGKALYKANETAEHVKGLVKLIAFKIHEAHLAVEEARKSAELAGSALTTAEEGQRLVRSRYENSLSPMVDLLDVQLSLDRARADAVARKNEYRVALMNLSYEGGTIMKDLNVE